MNQNRSKIAEEALKVEFNMKSVGLYNDKLLTEVELCWADLVVVMEDHQKIEMGKKFPKYYIQKRRVCLSVSDI